MRSRLGTVRAALVGGALALAAAGSPGPHVPAVLLLRIAPQSPDEALGTDEAPAVTARIHISERGIPSRVEILRFAPESPLRSAFERATRAALSEWRFAPALREGKAVPSTVDMTVEYSKPAGRPRSSSRVLRIDGTLPVEWGGPLGLDAMEMREGGRPRSGALDPRARRGVRDGLVERTKKCLRGTPSRATTESFDVFTDAPGSSIAAQIGSNLEASFATLSKMLAGKIPPFPDPDRTVVFAFASREAFREAIEGRAVAGHSPWSVYNPAGVLTFHLETPSSDTLTRQVLHEGARVFLDRHLLRPGVAPPAWLVEGLARYVENSALRDGRVVPGEGEPSDLVEALRTAGTLVIASAPHLDRLDASWAARHGEVIPPGQIFEARSEEFFGPRAQILGAQAFALVHFLRHGRPEWTERAFPRFLLYVFEGFESNEAFRASFGCAPDDLTPEYVAYLGRW